MPATSVTSQVSQAVYFASLFGLAVLLSRPVYLVYSGAQERSAQAVAFGLRSEIDAMSPGSSIVVVLQGYPGIRLAVSLEGTTVAASFGGTSADSPVKYSLPHATLVAGEAYNLTLEGGRIQVAQANHG